MLSPGMPLFVDMSLVTPPMNAIAQSRHSSISLSGAIGPSFSRISVIQAVVDLAMSPENSMSISSVGGSRTDFCGSAVKTVIVSTWWLSAASAEVFAPAAGQGGWQKRPRCWQMISYPTNPFVSECSVFLIRCDSYWPTTLRLSLQCWVSLTGQSQHI